MKRMLTHEQFRLLMNRNRIENAWSVMRLNYNLVYHRARSVAECSAGLVHWQSFEFNL